MLGELDHLLCKESLRIGASSVWRRGALVELQSSRLLPITFHVGKARTRRPHEKQRVNVEKRQLQTGHKGKLFFPMGTAQRGAGCPEAVQSASLEIFNTRLEKSLSHMVWPPQ